MMAITIPTGCRSLFGGSRNGDRHRRNHFLKIVLIKARWGRPAADWTPLEGGKVEEPSLPKWPSIVEWSEDQVMQAVSPSREKPDHRNPSPDPDYAEVRDGLQTHKHVTLQTAVGGIPAAVDHCLAADHIYP